MKKVVSGLLASILVFTLAGCGDSNDPPVSGGEEIIAQSENMSSDISVADDTVLEPVTVGEMSLQYDEKYSAVVDETSAAIVFVAQESFITITSNDTGYDINAEMEGTDISIEELLDLSMESYVMNLDCEDESQTYETLDGQTVKKVTCKITMDGGEVFDGQILTALVDGYQYYINYMCKEGQQGSEKYNSEFNDVLSTIKFD